MASLILSHHPPSQYDRCIRIGRQYVCRRCAVLYPLAFAVATASLLYLLPIPVTLEFVIERFGGIRHRAGRQIALTLLAAPALGRGLARYWTHSGDRVFWGMVLLFGGSALFALLATRDRDRVHS